MQGKDVETLIIDQQQCTGCGWCVAVCPHSVFEVEEGKVHIIGASCMECGHCQAICPAQCITVTTIVENLELQHIQEKKGVLSLSKLSPAKVVQLMRSRRSCRNYTEKKVPVSLLQDLVKIGITAPSGTNSQGWGFILAPDRQEVEKIGAKTAAFYKKTNRLARNPLLRMLVKLFGDDSLGIYYRKYYHSIEDGLRRWQEQGEDLLFHGATAAILVTGKKDASCPAEDALLATQNILLAAHSLGLGSCLIGFVVEAAKRDKMLRKALQVSENDDLYSVIALGYPAEKYVRPAGRKIVTPIILGDT